MQYFVNVSFANIYRKPTFHSEVDTQVVLWEELEVLERINSFLRVRTEDHYEGWLNEHQVAVCPMPQVGWIMIRDLFRKIYEKPDRLARILRVVSAGTQLPIISDEEGWAKVILPDEQTAFIPLEALKQRSSFTPGELVKVARRFMGVTYIWGGKTAFGLDCSGLVQLSCKLLGRFVRRDAWMQFEDSKPLSDDPAAARPGDLYFFSENGDKITHVAIALGKKRFIHARGMVRINSLNEDDADFSPELLRDFVQVRTFF